MKNNYTCLIQARMASRRLPGKVLLPISGSISILDFLATKLCGIGCRTVIATSTEASDDPIAKTIYGYFDIRRGSHLDVLDRLAKAASRFGSDEHLVRITADCPLVPIDLFYVLVSIYESNSYDYVAAATCKPHLSCWPDGFDCEIFKRDVLLDVNERAPDACYREHPTNYILEHPERYRCLLYESAEQYVDGPKLSVDTFEDYLRVWQTVQKLGNPETATASEIITAAKELE